MPTDRGVDRGGDDTDRDLRSPNVIAETRGGIPDGHGPGTSTTRPHETP